MLQNEASLAIVAVHTAENGPFLFSVNEELPVQQLEEVAPSPAPAAEGAVIALLPCTENSDSTKSFHFSSTSLTSRHSAWN